MDEQASILSWQVPQVGRTPSSARDPLVALLRSLSSFERDRMVVF
jgi:hypothetical protein